MFLIEFFFFLGALYVKMHRESIKKETTRGPTGAAITHHSWCKHFTVHESPRHATSTVLTTVCCNVCCLV